MQGGFRRELGRQGEAFACKMLRNQGFHILARNHRNPSGVEMDILASKDRCLYLVEVKTRREMRQKTSANQAARTLSPISIRQVKRLWRACESYDSHAAFSQYERKLLLVWITVKEASKETTKGASKEVRPRSEVEASARWYVLTHSLAFEESSLEAL